MDLKFTTFHSVANVDQEKKFLKIFKQNWKNMENSFPEIFA